MAIYYDGVMCDSCGDFEPLQDLPIAGKVRRIKNQGWRIMSDGGLYRHHCPECIDGLNQPD